MDVLEHLTKEHRQVERMLRALKETEPGDARDRQLVELRAALELHMAVEERFIYPLVESAIGGEEADDATDEHELARSALAAVEERAHEGAFNAAVEVLEQGISHHVEEEESSLFPDLRRRSGDELAAMDPARLAAQVTAEESTHDELYRAAKEAGIEGRSSMTKAELADALESE